MNNENTGTAFPQLNAPAPYFKAETTHGTKSLDDYKGKQIFFYLICSWYFFL